MLDIDRSGDNIYIIVVEDPIAARPNGKCMMTGHCDTAAAKHLEASR